MVLCPIFRVLHHVCSANVRWSTSSGSWVSGFLVEVQLLVESPQKLHPLASCWCHCGHWTSWAIMILMIMAKIMLSLIVDDDAYRDRATCTCLYDDNNDLMIMAQPGQVFLHLFPNLAAIRSCFRQSPKEPASVPWKVLMWIYHFFLYFSYSQSPHKPTLLLNQWFAVG